MCIAKDFVVAFVVALSAQVVAADAFFCTSGNQLPLSVDSTKVSVLVGQNPDEGFRSRGVLTMRFSECQDPYTHSDLWRGLGPET